jgi:hypothetical protein
MPTPPEKFQISTTSTLSDLDSVLSNMDIPLEPDWRYQPYSTAIKLADGTFQGNGFPIIKWNLNHISLSNREILRETYCPAPALSKADIYINTPITETDTGVLMWKTFKCILNWSDQEEDFQADKDLGLLLIFTHCEVQP